MLRWNFLCFSLCLLPLILSVDTTEKTPSLQLLTHFDQISPVTSLQVEQAQVPQPLLTWEVLQSIYHFNSLSLDSFQELHITLVLRSPVLVHRTPGEATPQLSKRIHRPAVNVFPNAAQDNIVLLLAHDQLVIHQNNHALLCRATVQQVSLQLLISEVSPPQMQDPAITFVEFQEVFLCPSLQPVEIFLNGIIALCDHVVISASSPPSILLFIILPGYTDRNLLTLPYIAVFILFWPWKYFILI